MQVPHSIFYFFTKASHQNTTKCVCTPSTETRLFDYCKRNCYVAFEKIAAPPYTIRSAN